mgnify:FL=1
MDQQQVAQIRDAVQHNCHVADAQHGSDYGLCTYLMKMREYFRWEKGLAFTDALANDEVGDWLTAREHLWAQLTDSEFLPICIDGCSYDAFDISAINDALQELGLVYSGGLGNSGRPHFFLGEMERREVHSDYALLVSGRELARDLAAPPAMMRDEMIFVRRESLCRMLWEKLESWRWRRPDNALGRAFSCYDFERDLNGSLEAMTDSELDLVLLHEQGECRAGEWLGEQWNRMLLDLIHTPAELAARAVRDHIADCMVTLPGLSLLDRPASVHFFMGNLGAMRKQLYPALQSVYANWIGSGDGMLLGQAAAHGERHWKRVADEMLALHRTHGKAAAGPLRELAESSRLED